MEVLRTYFEQKCLQMEKQYSEEIFSQQSKRISDNDSETEELTDDLYFGGAGDCLNANSNSRAATSDANEESLKDKMGAEKQARLEIEYEDSIQALRQELEHKVKKIQIIKADYEKAIKEQKELYERQIRDIEAKLERLSALPTVHQVRKNFLVMILCFINNIHLLIIAIFVPYLMCVVCKDCLLAIIIFEHPIIKQFKF